MHRRVLTFLPLVFLLAVALAIFSPLIADPDLWGHVRFGQDALLTGNIVRPDPYSYLTAGQPWINHEWLAEVLYASAYNVARSQGLIILNSLLNLLIAGLIFMRLRRSAMPVAGALLLTMGACLVLRPAVLTIRPQVFTYLLLLLLLLLIDAYTRELWWQRREAVFVALICAILAAWANLHGGILAGIGILYVWGIAYLAEAAIRARSLHSIIERPQRGALIALLLAPVALLLNPYGLTLITFLLRTATVARPEILEWHPVSLRDEWSWYYFAAAGLTTLAVVLSRRERRPCLILPLVVVMLLPITAVRHIPLFSVAAPVLAADHFADLWGRLAAGVRPKLRAVPFATRILPFATVVAGAALVLFALGRLQKIEIDTRSSSFPARAVATMKAAGIKGNMATEFNWAEYVIWQLAPGVRVSVDGRRETVYSEAVYRENLEFMQGEGQWDRVVDRPETELALVDRQRLAYTLMRAKPGWTLVYEDGTAAVFAREGSPAQAAVANITAPELPANGAGLAFPVE